MAGQAQTKDEDPFAEFTYTVKEIRIWIDVEWSVSYRRVLALGILVVVIFAGAKFPAVLEFVSNLMTVIGL